MFCLISFFFQAEDGIRDIGVTGVQTCALPIYRVFAAVDDETFEHHVEFWSSRLLAADAGAMDVLHLHHLTAMHEAAARVVPDVPLVGHLHGTELLMRSEEHTSELQSRQYLVCRLL